MINDKARASLGFDACPESGHTVRGIEEQLGAARTVIGRANAVWRYAPELVDPGIRHTVGLDRVYETARQNILDGFPEPVGPNDL